MNIQDPKVRQAVRSAVQEISASMTRNEAERDLIKEIVKKLSEDHSISKKAVKKMATAYHRQNFAKEAEDFDEFSTLYDTVMGAQTGI